MHRIIFTLDFDGDDMLSKGDLITTINYLTRNELSNEEVDFVCEKVGC